jgi:uncharacterized protein YegL
MALDVSKSMHEKSADEPESAAQRLNQVVPELCLSLADMPTIATRAWISVVCFSDVASVLVPSTSLELAPIVPEFPEGIQTNYAAAFSTLAEQCAADSQTLPIPAGRQWLPIVFLLTDGQPFVGHGEQPREVWLQQRDQLVARHGARIVTIGFGGANEDVLWHAATPYENQRLAVIDDGASDHAELLNAIKNAITRSIRRSVEVGDVRFDLPEHMRWASCTCLKS